MVMNSFGNRNFMQANGKAQHALKVPCYFSFKFWVVRGPEDFFSFFLCSQHVPFKFSMGSHQVLNVFPKGVPNSTSL